MYKDQFLKIKLYTDTLHPSQEESKITLIWTEGHSVLSQFQFDPKQASALQRF